MAPKALIVIWYYACQVKLLILKCSFVVLSCTAAVQTVKFLTATRTTRRQEAIKNYCNSVNCEEAIVQHKVCETGKCNIHIDFPFELKKKSISTWLRKWNIYFLKRKYFVRRQNLDPAGSVA